MIVNDDVRFELARRRSVRKATSNPEMIKAIMQTFTLQELQTLHQATDGDSDDSAK